MSNWYFFHQKKGGEEAWAMSLSNERDKVVNSIKPAFVTVLDISSVPTDGDWSKVRYKGPLYFDFDAGDDLPFVCEQFKTFLAKLHSELDFDITQARLFASGGKGFHVEIPEQCFLPKIPVGGTAWLPYIFREMAQDIIVDTLDLSVYTGKRGRMWRTTGVKRENGHFKVPLSVDEAMSMDVELYKEITAEARPDIIPAPPTANARLASLFDRSKDKIVTLMRTKKKRMEVANKFLDPWKKAKKTPPSITRLMNGEDVAEGAGFQQLSMQLAIYATSVEMDLDEYLDRCKGLCENHVSDSYRYNSPGKRREELARMFRYMGDNTLYEFDPGPLVRLTKPGSNVADLGVMVDDDGSDDEGPQELNEDGEPENDPHKGLRRGMLMNTTGIFKKNQDGGYDSMCRAHFMEVRTFFDLEKQEFRGYDFKMLAKGLKTKRSTLTAETFTSALAMKKFMAAHQLSYQGGEPETTALMDIMADRATKGGKVYTWPREGFFIVNHPDKEEPTPITCFLTQDHFVSSSEEGETDHFSLTYKPTNAISSYLIDVHTAPLLNISQKSAVRDIFGINKEAVVADLLGWFVAAHYRSVYLRMFKQFPMLQVYGESGAGKSKTVELFARMHWYRQDVSINSCLSCTPFALDSLASTSTSAPLILDEFKPRELRKMNGKYEKLKDIFKASYIGGDIGNRGTINRGAENSLAVVKSKATAPICFMGEAIEMETAIYERCISVNLSKGFHNNSRRAAFDRLNADSTALSSIGRGIIEAGFSLNLESMAAEMAEIKAQVLGRIPENSEAKREADRLVFNRAVVIHGLRILKHVLKQVFGSEFDATVNSLMALKEGGPEGEEVEVMHLHGMSELSKVLKRIARLSHEVDTPHEVRLAKDYLVEDSFVELNIERAYDQYRRWCSTLHDQPLFDNMEAFVQAFSSYTPCEDRVCAGSALRNDGTSDRIVRLNLQQLRREGVSVFRT